MAGSRVTDVFVNTWITGETSPARVTDLFVNVWVRDEPEPPGPAAVRDLVGKRLGCGKPRFFLYARGGRRRLAELQVASYAWGRKIDDTSSGQVTLGLEQSPECLPYLATLKEWERELVIFRDSSEVWVGPIVEPEWGPDGATLGARDLTVWFDHRFIHSDLDFENADLASIAAYLATDAMSVDDSPNILFAPSSTGILGKRSYRAAMYQKAADEIRELARTAFDFTAVGRTIRTGGVEVPTDPIVTLTNDTFDVDPKALKGRGLDQASRIVLTGGQDQHDHPITGEADLGIPASGVLESLVNESSILDQDSADAGAQTRLDVLKSAPFEITGTLSEDVAVTMDELIPGARVDVRLTVGFKELQGICRLHSVDVSGDSSGAEKVKVTLQSLGTTQ